MQKKKTGTDYFHCLVCNHQTCQTWSQISSPRDKETCISQQIAERHVTLARCDVRSVLGDQQKVNVPPKTWALPKSDIG